MGGLDIVSDMKARYFWRYNFSRMIPYCKLPLIYEIQAFLYICLHGGKPWREPGPRFMWSSVAIT